ncbi:unnamed protein product [Onchocerca flexuosa]|uniref:Uncharacterized protein n=1 Tax=Onchocerca flexuosa TaxID=387005 RepID=A0A183HQR6_9BILA|nr:unnamed protein product [Onchocerca flexuosa]
MRKKGGDFTTDESKRWEGMMDDNNDRLMMIFNLSTTRQ